MRVLVVGSGGREHAIIYALQKDRDDLPKIYCAPGNAGIAELAQCVPISATEINALARFAEDERIDLTIVGGETSLAAGLVNEFERRGLRVAGPRLNAARLESSKAFAKDFMARHYIPTANYKVVNSLEDARKILESGEFGNVNVPVVVKADGLAAGKGVVLARNRNEAELAVEDLISGKIIEASAAKQIVIEETLEGREASLLLFSDGKDYVLMPAARDHKRVGENDTGPNTGGMGAITSPEVLDSSTLARVVKEIVEPTLEGAAKDGIPFRGVLFIGLMLTNSGPKVLEYNVRFGDPETQAILVRLETNLIDICEAIVDKSLGELKVMWSNESSACVVLAARGYPARPETGAHIEGLENASRHEGVKIFHAGTKRGDAGEWIVGGGRVLGVTATGNELGDALNRCYKAIDDISWDGMHYRRDIGKFVEKG
jgi:phosphoribosylamine---glycine ligase